MVAKGLQKTCFLGLLLIACGFSKVFGNDLGNTDAPIEEEIKATDGVYPLLLPNVHPPSDESYLCTPIKLNPDETYYIVGFKPNATAATAHHMLVYGCDSKPGSSKAVWNCGEMARTVGTGMDVAKPCSGSSRVVYAWAMDAPELKLPPEVGFKVGRGSDINYLVLQVHYATVAPFKGGKTDDSGVFLHYTTKPQPKTAGVLLTSTGGVIMPYSTAHMEAACKINEDKIVHPFAFRTHTHSLGQVVSGYRVRKSEERGYDWQLIGKQDPQLPQMFYPVANDLQMRKGDIIASRCTMKSNRMRITTVGPTNRHEMCNFYMMYWVDGENPLDQKYCQTAGPPLFYWSWYGLRNIPEDASILD